MLRSVTMALEHKDGKLSITELTLGEWDLLFLQKVRSRSTCSNPPSSWVIWAVNGENGICGAECEESPLCFRSNASWSGYREPFENFS